jgi:hypothetical protein
MATAFADTVGLCNTFAHERARLVTAA